MSGQTLKAGMMTVTITGRYPSVTVTSNPKEMLITSRTDTVRRPRPVGAQLIESFTPFFALTRAYHDGYYTRDYGDYQRIAPVGEFFSSVGSYLEIDPSSEAAIRLRTKVRTQNVNLAQALAEYRQTANMVSSFMKDIASAYRSIRGGLPSLFSAAFRRLLSNRDPAALRAANRWLQYQYGVRPLMSDIYGSVELLRSKLSGGVLQKVTVSGQNSLDQAGYQWTSPPLTSYQKGRQYWHASAYYTVTDASIKRLSDVGITNPLALAWELIPYSFVIDWVIPVGRYLLSLDALNGVEVKIAYIVVKNNYRIDGYYYGGHQYTESRTYSRSLLGLGSLFPSLRYEPSSSATALANGVALLTQLLLK